MADEKQKINAVEAVEFIESILAQCSIYIQVPARRKVLDAMDVLRENVKKTAPPEKEAQD